VDESFAHLHRLEIGDTYAFSTPSGPLQLPILGTAEITPAMACGFDTIYISRGVYRKYWRDNRVNFIGLMLVPGAKRDAVMDEVRSRFGGANEIFVASAAEFRKAVARAFQNELAPLIPVFLFATVIALFGLVNSLLASVLDRTREIGTLRSIGTTKAQVGRLVLYEAVALAVTGTLLAIPAGFSMNLLNLIQNRVFAGSYIPFVPPGPLFLGLLFLCVTLLAALAGYLPARGAAGVVIREAIQSE